MNDGIATEERTFDYIAEANVTASNNYHGDKVPLSYLVGVLHNAITALQQLDKIKKALFYGRDPGIPEHLHSVGLGCQVAPGLIDAQDPHKGEFLLHSIVGTATEAGELLELLHKALVGTEKFDEINFIEEIGDGFWYAAIGLGIIGSNFGEVQYRNIAKLRHRFPQKFTEYDANNRDLFGERAILEMQTKPECGIENWIQVGNVLIGDLRGHPVHGDTEGSRTSAIVRMDEANGICETRNTIYKLGRKA
jgi:NTP pyrophosphatase (non-canonical NTP hydrolase)